MLKKSETIFVWYFHLKSKTKINIVFHQNNIALVYVWTSVYEIYMKYIKI